MTRHAIKTGLFCTDLTFMQPTDIIGLLRQVVDDTGYVERAASLCIDVAVSQYFRVWLCNQNSKGGFVEIFLVLYSTLLLSAAPKIRRMLGSIPHFGIGYQTP